LPASPLLLPLLTVAGEYNDVQASGKVPVWTDYVYLSLNAALI
jgi:hypothetical protein